MIEIVPFVTQGFASCRRARLRMASNAVKTARRLSASRLSRNVAKGDKSPKRRPRGRLLELGRESPSPFAPIPFAMPSPCLPLFAWGQAAGIREKGRATSSKALKKALPRPPFHANKARPRPHVSGVRLHAAPRLPPISFSPPRRKTLKKALAMPTALSPASSQELAAQSLSVLGEADCAVLVGVLSLVLSLVLSSVTLLRSWQRGRKRGGADK